jgi:hypothetical protein
MFDSSNGYSQRNCNMCSAPKSGSHKVYLVRFVSAFSVSSIEASEYLMNRAVILIRQRCPCNPTIFIKPVLSVVRSDLLTRNPVWMSSRHVPGPTFPISQVDQPRLYFVNSRFPCANLIFARAPQIAEDERLLRFEHHLLDRPSLIDLVSPKDSVFFQCHPRTASTVPTIPSRQTNNLHPPHHRIPCLHHIHSIFRLRSNILRYTRCLYQC